MSQRHIPKRAGAKRTPPAKAQGYVGGDKRKGLIADQPPKPTSFIAKLFGARP